jgi:hypothetical protein
MTTYQDRAGFYDTFYVGDECDRDIFPSPGWYWRSHIPGYGPEERVCGPFLTQQEAMDSAMDEELLII